MIDPDGWICIHSVDENVVGPEAASHGFGPFMSVHELQAFEASRADRCVKTVVPLFLPPRGGLVGIEINAAMTDLMVLGALSYNWLGTSHADQIGHDHHCALPGLDPGEAELCSCGWSTFYAKYLELEREEVEATSTSTST